MNVTITMKSPDALDYTLEQVKEQIPEGTDEEEQENILEAARTILKRFLEYGEYLYVDVDLDTGTATVRSKG